MTAQDLPSKETAFHDPLSALQSGGVYCGEIVIEGERGIAITDRRCRRIPMIQVYLGTGGGDGGNLDPDDRIVGPGLLDPVVE